MCGFVGVVFPAIKTSADKAVDAFKAKGVDVAPFTHQVNALFK